VPTLPAVIVDLQNARIRRDPAPHRRRSDARADRRFARMCGPGETLVSVAATLADLAQMTGQGTATRLL
jgi:hypothetical protein